VTLIGAQTQHVTCKTCRLRFCRECQHWKTDRRQTYCASCGANFSIPPSAIPLSILMLLLHAPLLIVVIIGPFARAWFWPVVLVAVVLPLAYTAVYLATFYRRTGLVRATRREAALLARRTVMLAAVAYIIHTLNAPGAPAIWIIVALALVIAGLAIRRADAGVIQELQSHRRVWEAILSLSNRDALLLRFPQTQPVK
jgi:hypothetical protein